MTEVADFAAALGRLPSGLFILTAGVGDAASGMLVSWVQQCSFNPPTISLAVKHGRHLGEFLIAHAPFVINIVPVGQSQLLSHFGRGFGPGEPAFVGIETTLTADEIPIITAALGHLQCRVVARHPAGDHDLVIGRVESGRLHSEAAPFVHIRKSGLNY